MQASSQSSVNRGNARQNARGGESLRRSVRPVQSVPEETKKEGEERSPLLLLARRIREEQGAEGLRAFLHAMEPFAAPYELKNLASRFGMEHAPSGSTAQNNGFSANQNNAFSMRSGGFSPHNNQNNYNMSGAGGMNGAPMSPSMGFDPNLIRMMQLMNGMGNTNAMNANTGGTGNSGGMMQIMQLMRLLPMLQNMGKGGADPAQFLKMMNM